MLIGTVIAQRVQDEEEGATKWRHRDIYFPTLEIIAQNDIYFSTIEIIAHSDIYISIIKNIAHSDIYFSLLKSLPTVIPPPALARQQGTNMLQYQGHD
jgi:hypothetical protein